MVHFSISCGCRSIGDFKAGDRVTPEPSVRQVTLSGSGGRIIIASDGVWDAVHSGGKGAAHRVRNQACTKAASNIRTYSKDQRSRDDITVIVADMMPDTAAKLPPALSDPASAASISTKGDCSSSVASLAQDLSKKVRHQHVQHLSYLSRYGFGAKIAFSVFFFVYTL
jgi:hypothetical protein